MITTDLPTIDHLPIHRRMIGKIITDQDEVSSEYEPDNESDPHLFLSLRDDNP
jgi:hypothetical protein